MKLTYLGVLALISCGPGRTTMARYPTAAPTWDRAASDAKAVEIADKVVAAAGGMDKWAAVKQIRWNETVTNDGKVVLEGEAAWDRWNARQYARLIGDHGDVVIHHELYGERDEAYGEEGGKRQELGEKEKPNAMKVALERWQFDTAALCMPFLLEDVGSHLAYVGQAAGDNGLPLEVLKLTFDAKDPARLGTAYQVDIDPATSTIARIEVVKPGGNIGYKPGNWTEVKGMKFPTTENNIGLPGEVITYKKIEIGDVEDGLFVKF
ncbi:MAG: hypothetical protein ABI591_23435 [Kofleriaceae bacterium]